MATRKKSTARRPARKRRNGRRKRKDSFLWEIYLFLTALWRFLVQSFHFGHRTMRGGIHAFQWWWELPRWLKIGKILVILAVTVGITFWGSFSEWRSYNSVYSRYYAHFYAFYQKNLLTPSDSAYYANYYANFYAKYYSSPAYRASLTYALPSATQETTSYPADSINASMRTSENGLALIKQFEGIRLKPYTDVGGKLTIGYGHLVKPGEFYTQMTEQQAHELLREDVLVAEAYVKRYVQVKLNHNQFAALVSLVYNIGPGNFKSSTLLEHLNDGNYRKAGKEFLRWERVGTRVVDGLSRRRATEKRLFDA